MVKKTRQKNCRKKEAEIIEHLARLDQHIRWLKLVLIQPKPGTDPAVVQQQIDHANARKRHYENELKELWGVK